MHVLDITIDHTKVAADLTDFPVLIVPADSADWDALYAVATGSGGDIRCFKAGGSVELPREVVSFSIDLKTGEIHVTYTGTLSSTVDTVIELHADGVSADYAVSATYGRNAVWSGYRVVSHLASASTDSTGNGFNGASTNVTYAAGKIGNAASFNGTNSSISFGTPATAFTQGSISLWARPPGTSGIRVVLSINQPGQSGLQLYQNGSNWIVQANSAPNTIGSLAANTWYHLVASFDGTTMRGYRNTTTVSTTLVSVAWTASLRAARNGDGNFFNGLLDEIRLTSSVLSVNWITTEYNNQNSPATFYTVTAVSTGTDYPLICDPGTMSLAGAEASLSINRAIIAETGTLALAAEPVALALSWNLALETGTLELSSEPASLTWSTSLAAAPGTLSLEAQNAILRLSYTLDAQSLDLAVNGAPAAISVALTQPLEPGSLLLGGEPVDFLVASIINPFCPMPNPFTNSASPFSQMDNPLTDFPKGEC